MSLYTFIKNSRKIKKIRQLTNRILFTVKSCINHFLQKSRESKSSKYLALFHLFLQNALSAFHDSAKTNRSASHLTHKVRAKPPPSSNNNKKKLATASTIHYHSRYLTQTLTHAPNTRISMNDPLYHTKNAKKKHKPTTTQQHKRGLGSVSSSDKSIAEDTPFLHSR